MPIFKIDSSELVIENIHFNMSKNCILLIGKY